MFFFLVTALAIALPTRADGLKQNLIPANSRWVLHLDAEAFRKSRIGAMIVERQYDLALELLVEDARRRERNGGGKIGIVERQMAGAPASGTAHDAGVGVEPP